MYQIYFNSEKLGGKVAVVVFLALKFCNSTIMVIYLTVVIYHLHHCNHYT